MTAPLHAMFSSLSKEKQDELRKLLDEHESHLGTLKHTSQDRLQSIMQSNAASSKLHQKGTTHGPGMYLSRWNSLLDSTLISPESAEGPVRRGWEVKGELDGKGLKTATTLLQSKKSKDKNTQMMADGSGDSQERKERKRDGLEEDKMATVWDGMRDGWVGVCRGLEVMGPD